MQHLLDTKSAATANNRYRALQRFFAFLADEGEITASPMARMKPPSVPEPVTAVLSDDELRRLFAECDGARFEDRRDVALFRLLADTGCRSAEVMGLKLDDLDRDGGFIFVMGKGSRPAPCRTGRKRRHRHWIGTCGSAPAVGMLTRRSSGSGYVAE